MKALETTMSHEARVATHPQKLEGLGEAVVDWNGEATRVLKSVLARYGVSNSELIEQLAKSGVDETRKGLEAKLRRGAFSVAYLLQCMNALGIDSIEYLLPRKTRRQKLKISNDVD